MARRTFAICTGNMYAFKFFVRIIQCFTQLQSISEIFFKSSSANATKHRKRAIKIIECFCVSHPAKLENFAEGYKENFLGRATDYNGITCCLSLVHSELLKLFKKNS